MPEWQQHADPALLADMTANPHLYFSVEGRPSQRAALMDPHVAVLAEGPNQAGKSLIWVVYATCAMVGQAPFELPDLLDLRSPVSGMRLLPDPPIYVRHFCVDLKRTAEKVILKHYLKYIPSRFLDTERGENGYNSKENTLYLTQGPPCFGSYVQLMSYDMQALKSQSTQFHIGILDEAPRQSLFEDQFPRIIHLGGRLLLSCTITDSSPWDTSWIRKLFVRGGATTKKYCGAHTLSSVENFNATAREKGARGVRLLENVEAMKALVRQSRLKTILWGEDSHRGQVVYSDFDERTHGYDVQGMTPDLFRKLADKGKGEIRCGMDYGTTDATAVVYVYIAREAIPELKLWPGDCVQIAEFYQARSNLILNLPPLQALHKRFGPLSYSVDPSMWHENSTVPGASPAVMLMDVKAFKRIIAGTPADGPMDTTVNIGPLYAADNDVDRRIDMVSMMLRPRGEPAPWPRYRLMVPENPQTCEGLASWSTKADPNEDHKKVRYQHGTKHGPDAVGYFAVSPALESWQLPPQSETDEPGLGDGSDIFGVPDSLSFHFGGSQESARAWR